MPTAPKPPSNKATAPVPPSTEKADPVVDQDAVQAVEPDPQVSEPVAAPEPLASETEPEVTAPVPPSADSATETVESAKAQPDAEQITAPAVDPVVTEAASPPVLPVATTEPAHSLSASEVLQRRMGLGKLIADRLCEKLSDDEQHSLVQAHVSKDFDEYSRLVALIQYRPRKAD